MIIIIFILIQVHIYDRIQAQDMFDSILLRTIRCSGFDGLRVSKLDTRKEYRGRVIDKASTWRLARGKLDSHIKTLSS